MDSVVSLTHDLYAYDFFSSLRFPLLLAFLLLLTLLLLPSLVYSLCFYLNYGPCSPLLLEQKRKRSLPTDTYSSSLHVRSCLP
jgi:hypothetical protein